MISKINNLFNIYIYHNSYIIIIIIIIIYYYYYFYQCFISDHCFINNINFLLQGMLF